MTFAGTPATTVFGGTSFVTTAPAPTTEEDGLSNNQIRRIVEDQNRVVWFETGFGISSYDGERISAHTSRDYTSKDDWQLGAGDLWFKGDERHGFNKLEGEPGVYRYDGEKFASTIDPGIVRAALCAARPAASSARPLVSLQLTQLALQPSKLNAESSSPRIQRNA